MTASLFARHKVNDFATWKKVYDGRVPAAKEEGLIAESVHRGADDPNTVIVYHQFGDLSATQEFMAAMNKAEFQAVLKNAGVQPETLEMWVGEDV
jgi:quinol monooxygenase YgiN